MNPQDYSHSLGAGPEATRKASDYLRHHWGAVPAGIKGGEPSVLRSGLHLGGVRWPADPQQLGRNDAVADAFPVRSDEDGNWVLLSDASTAVDLQVLVPLSVPSGWFPEPNLPGCPGVIVRGFRTGNPDNNVVVKDRPLTSDTVHIEPKGRTSSVIWGTNRRGNYSEFKGAGFHWLAGVVMSPELEAVGLGGPFHDNAGGINATNTPGWVAALNFVLPEKAGPGSVIGTVGTNGGNVQAGQGRFFQIASGRGATSGTNITIPPSIGAASGTAPTSLGSLAGLQIPNPASGGSVVEVGTMAGGYRGASSMNDGPIMADSLYCVKHHKKAVLGTDGNVYCESCGHTSTEAFYKVPGNPDMDGPLEFFESPYIPEHTGPYPFVTQLRPDNRYVHLWNGKTLPMQWRWETWVPLSGVDDGELVEYPPPTPPWGPPPGEPPPGGPPGPSDGPIDPTNGDIPGKPDLGGAHDMMTPYRLEASGFGFVGRPVGDDGVALVGQLNPRSDVTPEGLTQYHTHPVFMRQTGIAQRFANGSPRTADRPAWMAKDLRAPGSGLLYTSPAEIQPDLPGVDTLAESDGSKGTVGFHPQIALAFGGTIVSDSDDAHTMVRNGWRLWYDTSNGRFNIDYLDADGAIDNTKDIYVNGSPIGGGGDVVGPASATDNAVARFDLTTGKLIQDSGVTIDDSGNITANSIASLTTPLTVANGGTGRNTLTASALLLGAGTGGIGALAVGTANYPVKVNSGGTAFEVSQLGTTGISDEAITYAKMQHISAASRILGRGSAAGAGDVQELTAGNGLHVVGTEILARLTATIDTTSSVSLSTGMTYHVGDTDSAGSDIEYTLPGTIKDGDTYYVQKQGSGGNVVVTEASGNTLNGVTDGSLTISTEYETVMIVGNSSGHWFASLQSAPTVS